MVELLSTFEAVLLLAFIVSSGMLRVLPLPPAAAAVLEGEGRGRSLKEVGAAVEEPGGCIGWAHAP